MTDTGPDRPDALFHLSIAPKVGSLPYPGLLLLHGRGRNETDLLSIGPYLDPRLFVVSARAPFTLMPGSYYWYDLEASLAGRPSSESIQFSLEAVSRFLDQIVPAYGLDPSRLFIGGFSMGAAMSAASALMFPDRVAGAIVLSGYLPIHAELPYRPQECQGHPIFQGHGTLDDVLPVELGRMTRDYLLRTPVDLTYREYVARHEVPPQELTDASEWMRNILGPQVP
ncbi:MAG TPA: alpha/beta fold hydrolase [Chloroflexota bacterium]|nr:alpha/beta fold hydrolase [Chloroflexota bacterium]